MLPKFLLDGKDSRHNPDGRLEEELHKISMMKIESREQRACKAALWLVTSVRDLRAASG